MPDKRAPVFTRAVVALSGRPTDELILRAAVELGRPWRAELVAVHVVEIDWTLPLDANVASISDNAQRVLDAAEAFVEHLGYALESVLVQARDVGAALVDEAVERAGDLLIVGLPYRKKFGGDFAIGRTVPYVLKNSPSAVWVVREPMPEEYRT